MPLLLSKRLTTVIREVKGELAGEVERCTVRRRHGTGTRRRGLLTGSMAPDSLRP